MSNPEDAELFSLLEESYQRVVVLLANKVSEDFEDSELMDLQESLLDVADKSLKMYSVISRWRYVK